MVRKGAAAAKPQKSEPKPNQPLLKLSEIIDAVSYSLIDANQELPPGFTRSNEESSGKVSPFSKGKGKAAGYTYDYPKGSPFKMVQKKKTAGEETYQDLVEGTKRGMIHWKDVSFSQKAINYLQKNLHLLDE